MKIKYIGKSFGALSLTNGKTYIATVGDAAYYRVFDDSGEDYLYAIDNPKPLDSSSDGGIWEVVEGMTEEEKELFEKFKNGSEDYNTLAQQSVSIAEKYARLYEDEIEQNVLDNLKKYDI